MKNYEVIIYVSGQTEETLEETANALFVAGCDDTSSCLSGGTLSIRFGREADSLETAVALAVRQVIQAGLNVDRVELEHAEVIALIGR